MWKSSVVVRAKKGTDGNNRKASCERRNKNSQTHNDAAFLVRVLSRRSLTPAKNPWLYLPVLL